MPSSPLQSVVTRRPMAATCWRRVRWRRSTNAVLICQPHAATTCGTASRVPNTTRWRTRTRGRRRTVLITWTSYHLSRPRERFLPLHEHRLSTARIIERVVTQHGHQHAEETVSNTTYSTSMTLPLSLEGGVDTREICIALGHAMCPMIERIAQTRVAATPHHHLTAFPALLRDRCHAALRA